MPRDRRGIIQNLIRRYVRGTLMKQCTREPLPLGEVALAKHFHTTRTTVQMACRNLIEDGSLIRLPGRRGLFISPAHAAIRGPGIDIRILYGNGREMIVDYNSQNILEGFTREMKNYYGDYRYTGILSSTPDEIFAELMEASADACLWLLPDAKSIPVAERLVDAGVPLVAVGFHYDADLPNPSFNTILTDYSLGGRIKARFVLENAFRNPAWFGVSSTTFQAFRETLEREKQPFDPRNLVEPKKGEIKELAGMLRTRKPDILFADGAVFPLIDQLETLVPNLKDIHLYLAAVPRAFHIQKTHPELKIVTAKRPADFFMRRMGKRAAQILKQMNGKGIRFESISMPLDSNEKTSNSNNRKGNK